MGVQGIGVDQPPDPDPESCQADQERKSCDAAEAARPGGVGRVLEPHHQTQRDQLDQLARDPHLVRRLPAGDHPDKVGHDGRAQPYRGRPAPPGRDKDAERERDEAEAVDDEEDAGDSVVTRDQGEMDGPRYQHQGGRELRHR